MNIDKDNPTWKLAEKAVSPEHILDKSKVSTAVLQYIDSKQQKALLSQGFSSAFRSLVTQPNTHYRCFNADHADKHPSMVFDEENGHFHCYGCMETGFNIDVFDVIKEVYQFKRFPECFNKAVELFSDAPEIFVPPVPVQKFKTPMFPKAMYKAMCNPYYHKIADDIYGLQYMESRGITRDTAIKYGLMTWEYRGWWFIVFVNDNGTVVRRRFAKTDDARGYADEPPKWWNQSGEGGFFNLREIELARPKAEIVFVTESAIDTLSVLQCGYHAVGLNSVNKVRPFLKEADYPFLYGLFDNDDAGCSNTEILKQYGYSCATYNENTPFISQYKDINEALAADPNRTKADLATLNALATAVYKDR